MLNGHPDICNVLDKNTAEHKAKLELFGFPTECPVPKGRKCMDDTNKIDISPYKGLLPMAAGEITANYDVTHDTVISQSFSVILFQGRFHMILVSFQIFQGKTCAVVKFEIKK